MIKLLLQLSISVFLTTSIIAQTNNQAFDWAFNTGGSGDKVKKMMYNSSGDLFVLGEARDTAAFGDVVIGAPKVGSLAGVVQYLGKKSSGNTYSVLFSTFASTGRSIIPTDFCMDATGNFYVIGTVNTVPPTLADFGNGVTLDSNCLFVAKFNPQGVAQWAKKFRFGTNTATSPMPLNIALYPNGDVLFIGQYYASNANGTNPVRFIRLNNNGNEIWQREYFFTDLSGSTLSFTSQVLKPSLNGFVMDNFGNFYMRQHTMSQTEIKVNADTVTAQYAGAGEYVFFCAFNNNGLKKYYKGYKAAISDMAVEPNTGNIILSYGQQSANPAPFNTLPTALNMFSGQVITDSLFNFIKSSSHNAGSTGAPLSIYPLGNYKTLSVIKYCKGNTITAGTQTYTNPTNNSLVWAETDANCAPLYFAVTEPVFTGSCGTPEHLVLTVNANKAAVCGSLPTTTSVTINGTTLVANNKNPTPTSTPQLRDVFITQFDRTLQTTTGVIAVNNTYDNISIYPNPANEFVAISNIPNNSKLSVINITGKVVYSSVITNNQTSTINISNLTSGIYLIRIDNSNTSITKKLVINN